MSNLLNISSSPHVRDKSSTRSIMWDVIFALIPTSIFGIYNFGIRAAVLIAVCIATCLLSEYIWQKCMKLPLTVNDGSAVLTGLLLALNLTPTFPIWMAIFPDGIFCRTDDKFCTRWNHRCYTACDH